MPRLLQRSPHPGRRRAVSRSDLLESLLRARVPKVPGRKLRRSTAPPARSPRDPPAPQAGQRSISCYRGKPFPSPVKLPLLPRGARKVGTVRKSGGVNNPYIARLEDGGHYRILQKRLLARVARSGRVRGSCLSPHTNPSRCCSHNPISLRVCISRSHGAPVAITCKKYSRGRG